MASVSLEARIAPGSKSLALGIPFALALAYCLASPNLIVSPDSASYLDWLPIRTSPYPLFLKLTDGPMLLPIQLLMFAGTVSWAAWYSFRLTGSLLFAALLEVALLANPYVWRLQGSVMSEALTTPLLIVFAGLMLGYLVRREARLLLGAALLAGVLAATRPSNLPLILAPLLSVLLTRGKTKVALLCLAVAVAPIVADKLVTRAVFGDRAASLLGRHAFAKAALVDAPPLDRSTLDPTEQRLADLSERDYAPIRDRLRNLPPSIRDVLGPNYEVCLQYACTDRRIAAPDEAKLAVGLARLRENPVGYLGLAVQEYRTLWLLHPRKHPDLAPRYNAWLAANPVPLANELGPDIGPVPKAEQNPLYRFNRLLFAVLALLVPALTVGLLFVRRRPLLGFALACLASLQFVLVFTALVGIGAPRYTMGVWPLFAFGLVPVAAALHYRIHPPNP